MVSLIPLMSEIDIPTIINSALVLAGVIGVPSLLIMYKRGKAKLSKFRKFVDSLDDAMTDDRVTNEEFDQIYANGKALLTED